MKKQYIKPKIYLDIKPIFIDVKLSKDKALTFRCNSNYKRKVKKQLSKNLKEFSNNNIIQETKNKKKLNNIDIIEEKNKINNKKNLGYLENSDSNKHVKKINPLKISNETRYISFLTSDENENFYSKQLNNSRSLHKCKNINNKNSQNSKSKNTNNHKNNETVKKNNNNRSNGVNEMKNKIINFKNSNYLNYKGSSSNIHQNKNSQLKCQSFIKKMRNQATLNKKCTIKKNKFKFNNKPEKLKEDNYSKSQSKSRTKTYDTISSSNNNVQNINKIYKRKGNSLYHSNNFNNNIKTININISNYQLENYSKTNKKPKITGFKKIDNFSMINSKSEIMSVVQLDSNIYSLKSNCDSSSKNVKEKQNKKILKLAKVDFGSNSKNSYQVSKTPHIIKKELPLSTKVCKKINHKKSSIEKIPNTNLNISNNKTAIFDNKSYNKKSLKESIKTNSRLNNIFPYKTKYKKITDKIKLQYNSNSFMSVKLKVKKINESDFNKIILIADDNWGNILKTGFNNIKLFDKNNKRIEIKNSNFDMSNPFKIKNMKNDNKKFIIQYEKNYILKKIEIVNGLGNTGIKKLSIMNENGKILWKGIIPKSNMIGPRVHVIILKDENSKTINSSNNKTISMNNLEISNDNNKNYVDCDRIKIKLLNNYGNSDYIGLAGIEIYDINDVLISNNENFSYIKINQNIRNDHEKQILNNLFNGINYSTHPKYMFLTIKENAFIDIGFIDCVKIKEIIFYNYNYVYYGSSSVKNVNIYFYKKNICVKSFKKIFLYKSPFEEYIDYGQSLIYPFNNTFTLGEKVLPIKNENIIYNEKYEYYCPSYPSGYIIKMELISNWGNKNNIGLNLITFFDEDGNEINLKNEKICKNVILPGNKKFNLSKEPMIFCDYLNFNDVISKGNSGEINRIYIIFNYCVIISKIKIKHYEKNKEISVKDIKIFMDDNVIFEGELKINEINNIYFSEHKIENIQNNNINDSKKNNNKNIIKSGNVKNVKSLGRYIEIESKDGVKSLLLS